MAAPSSPARPAPGQSAHLGQVHGHVQVVVQEVGVLLGVQQLEQRRRGVPLVTPANLVHLEGQKVGGAAHRSGEGVRGARTCQPLRPELGKP